MARDEMGVLITPEEHQVFREMLAERAGHGPRAAMLQELERLPPDIAGVDVLDFRCQISAAGVITQPAPQSLPSGFWAALTGVTAWMQAPATDPESAALVTFNVRDQGRTENLFSTDWYVASLFNPLGGQRVARFGGGIYRFDPATRISVKFAIDTDATNGYDANVDVVKHWGVTLEFALFAVKPLRR